MSKKICRNCGAEIDDFVCIFATMNCEPGLCWQCLAEETCGDVQFLQDMAKELMQTNCGEFAEYNDRMKHGKKFVPYLHELWQKEEKEKKAWQLKLI